MISPRPFQTFFPSTVQSFFSRGTPSGTFLRGLGGARGNQGAMWRGSTAGAPGSASCESAGGVQRIVGLVAQPPRSSLRARLARRPRSRSQAWPKNPLCQPESDCEFLTLPAFLFFWAASVCDCIASNRQRVEGEMRAQGGVAAAAPQESVDGIRRRPRVRLAGSCLTPSVGFHGLGGAR